MLPGLEYVSLRAVWARVREAQETKASNAGQTGVEHSSGCWASQAPQAQQRFGQGGCSLWPSNHCTSNHCMLPGAAQPARRVPGQSLPEGMQSDSKWGCKWGAWWRQATWSGTELKPVGVCCIPAPHPSSVPRIGFVTAAAGPLPAGPASAGAGGVNPSISGVRKPAGPAPLIICCTTANVPYMYLHTAQPRCSHPGPAQPVVGQGMPRPWQRAPAPPTKPTANTPSPKRAWPSSRCRCRPKSCTRPPDAAASAPQHRHPPAPPSSSKSKQAKHKAPRWPPRRAGRVRAPSGRSTPRHDAARAAGAHTPR